MQILIVSATRTEIDPVFRKLSGGDIPGTSIPAVVWSGHQINFLITGIGGVATSVALSAHLSGHKYDLVLNTGIAGSFRKDFQIGDVVVVKSERFGDLGIEEADGSFSDLFDAGLLGENSFPFVGKMMECTLDLSKFKFLQVTGLTVNRVHGSERSIRKITEKYQPDIETMEGAAFFYTCVFHQQKCMQLRAISNYVEKRNREKWNIPLSIENLATHVCDLLKLLPAQSDL
jgi:futalosine hydrolase